MFLLRATPIFFFPSRLFWFVFGIIVSQQLTHLKPWLRRYRAPLLVSMILFAALSVTEYVVINNYVSPNEWLGPNFNGFGRDLFSLAVLLTFIAYSKTNYPAQATLSDLGVKSLGIYLVNTPAMYLASALIYHQLPWVLGQPLLYQGTLFVVGFATPLLLMSITVKTPVFRPGYRRIFG
jgi:hypothetical protein